MLLAIDSSTGTSVAVVDLAGGILAEQAIDDTMSHAEVVGALLGDTLREAGVVPADLSAVACGMGPGPFTGLRIGIAAARAFAFGAGKPVVPLVSHDAVAFAWYSAGNEGDLLVETDARRKELYWSAYAGLSAAGLPVRVGGPGLARPEDVPESTGTRLEAAAVSAGALGMLAELTWAAGNDFAADEPLYLRSPDVSISSRKRVTS
ncbi:tRNA (adenosine(37)-N6)-threonylcarbamoyltransferase complex dimerization subunit type 1 TsaB [Mycetocola manganoxydans]|uniref:tRNA (Adenosine(37)-N6)-threonylcarbamoyltransferase complex dimerization subunit type 1 TsaB n=1 Tax=Mycetocola manganoxydans TaxID=699879 RepID=A0A3L6ZWZ4_9MICO|nr:tRNA (adenosine(37)-N6)-threonylcarbamoyltransferase complex dimerization subunit type 1 TsaB [Mycetocola manganoxydans]RLP72021.1 tRNA (adenosine(37)-N6)-threonylcarbamoyltransferase complex dimerization subunit type 1 TsaB [Mycetocola manganoxydans]GHD47581.1 tRNA (adenosine(37)-N6)-threonylcarbamoyltransferase complex dimerization subunit type 1 TsaB [Mycetocola manganoxydans]